jgi:hypothetical protein
MTLLFHIFVAAAVAGLFVYAIPRLEHRMHRMRPPVLRMEPPQAFGAMFAMLVAMWLLLSFTPR